ncbi:hypothetical protein LQW54_011553 [Pestalotiopsis sp. IQ-011]
MSKFCLSLLAAGLGLGQLASAGFDPTIQSNVAVYWGQNSYGQANSQLRLSEYCSNIKTCQTTYGKTILLSLGGATYTEGGFTSAAAAKAAADNIWNLFGPNTATANRPFRSAVIDGFDFDFESTTSNTIPFAQELRSLMTAATSAGDKKYFLSAAPQCPYPDAADNDILSNVAMDFVMVQFYNNYCGIQSFTPGTSAQYNFNMQTWDTWAKQQSKNPNVKVFLGVPANTGAGAGYLPASQLAPIISYCKTFTSFGGVMMWDMSQMAANPGFLDGVYSALTGSASPPASTPASTLSTVRSSTAASTTTSTLLARSSSSTSASSVRLSTTAAPTCACATAVTVTATVTTTVFTGSTAAAPQTTKTSTTQSASTGTPSTGNPSTGNQQLVNQWGQCGGQGYNGPTQCRAPFTCVRASTYWSDCR